MINRRFLAFATAALALTAATAATAGDSATIVNAGVHSHPSQGEVRPIGAAAAELITTADGAFISVATAGLNPGHAHTLWVVAINAPEACETRPCKSADVFQRTASTQSDLGFGDGLIAAADGTARFAARIPTGDLRQSWFGNGYHNPHGAEIHVTIADHGPVVPGLEQSMISSYRGGCTDDSLSKSASDAARGDGMPGPNACRVVQFAVFEQPAAQL